MSSTKRRPARARLDWEAIGELTGALLSHWSRDDKFSRSLIDLYGDHKLWLTGLGRLGWTLWGLELIAREDSNHSDEVRYLDDLQETANQWGLWRVPNRHSNTISTQGRSYGELLIHRWCMSAAEGEQRGLEPNPRTFQSMSWFGGWPPDILPGGEVPRINIEFDEPWDPTHESPSCARDRIGSIAASMIEEQISSIARRAEKRGYGFDGNLNAERDLTWLFWKFGLDLSYEQIKTRWNEASEKSVKRNTVATAIPRIADAIGFDRTP